MTPCTKCGAEHASAADCPHEVQTVVAPATPVPAKAAERILPEVGRPFGGYLIHRQIGAGGMGAVFEAEHLESGRRIALKILGRALDSADDRKRFLREGRLAASLNHPNTVYVYGTEEVHGTPIITMELVEGGTLQDRVQRHGPMPPAAAADAILHVIAGLEAAHAAGILHRDIKPTNCFVDLDGTVKVGDFGLSISTVARTDTSVTLAGSFVGTPAFASPEQLRGDELDVRSDIYSVGVTLYYLLTGRLPFAGDNLVKLIATILERPPDRPPGVPRNVARIVLKCLEKSPAARYRSYADLRRALMPIASARPDPATLGLRFGAGAIDTFVYFAILMFSRFLFFGDMAQEGLRSIPYTFIGPIFWLLYFALPEGRFGASLGKWICGMRVTGGSMRQALVRAAIFTITPSIPTWIYVAIDPIGAVTGSNPMAGAIIGLSWWAIFAILFSTARLRNGFAGLHDLASRTRVVQRAAVLERQVVAVHREAPPPLEGTAMLGPYHVLGSLAPDLQIGYDPQLFRRVWIRRGSSLPEQRAKGRAGRLRWVNGRRTPGDAWDAFEALSGGPPSGRSPWSVVRLWLLDLAEEFRAGLLDGSLPPELGLDRVWITAEGRAKLLDFPAPGTTPSPTYPASSWESGRRFLRAVAAASVSQPLPVHAMEFLDRMETIPDPERMIHELRSISNRVAEVTRARKVTLVALCAAPPLVVAAMSLVGVSMYQAFLRDRPEMVEVMVCLARLEQLERDPDARAEREALEVYVAGRHGERISKPETWSDPLVQLFFPPAKRARAQRIATERGRPPDDELEAATAMVEPWLRPQVRKLDEPYMAPVAAFISIAAMLFFFFALPAVVAALVARGGLLLQLFGLVVVRRDGAPASRLRIAWRALVAWSPVLLVPALLPLPMRFLFPLPLLLVAGALASALARGRSLQDRIAGTNLVPK